MNIFYLHKNPHQSARMHCDKHCVKMILETAQLLSTAHRELDGDNYANLYGLYKSTHKNHPSAVWVRQSTSNYQWAYELLKHLCEEYTSRYGKVHKTSRLLHALNFTPMNIPVMDFTPPPQCMPDEYKQKSTVGAYRHYYLNEKLYMAKWAYSDTPAWVTKGI